MDHVKVAAVEPSCGLIPPNRRATARTKGSLRMARYTGPKARINRRLNTLIYETAGATGGKWIFASPRAGQYRIQTKFFVSAAVYQTKEEPEPARIRRFRTAPARRRRAVVRPQRFTNLNAAIRVGKYVGVAIVIEGNAGRCDTLTDITPGTFLQG